MVSRTLKNFGKRYKDNLRVIFDQWAKLHLGFDALSNQKSRKVSIIFGSNENFKICFRYLLTFINNIILPINP